MRYNRKNYLPKSDVSKRSSSKNSKTVEEFVKKAVFPANITLRGGCKYEYFGISKRELFSAMIMQGTMNSIVEDLSQTAELSVQAADALINELNK